MAGPGGTQTLSIVTSCDKGLACSDQFGSVMLVQLETTGGGLKTWFAVANAPVGTTSVFLKEGAVEMIAPLQSAPPAGMQVNLWNGVTLVDELDELELRNAAGLTLANGTRDTGLPEPA